MPGRRRTRRPTRQAARKALAAYKRMPQNTTIKDLGLFPHPGARQAPPKEPLPVRVFLPQRRNASPTRTAIRLFSAQVFHQHPQNRFHPIYAHTTFSLYANSPDPHELRAICVYPLCKACTIFLRIHTRTSIIAQKLHACAAFSSI